MVAASGILEIDDILEGWRLWSAVMTLVALAVSANGDRQSLVK